MMTASEAAVEFFDCPACFAHKKEPCANSARAAPHARRLGRGEGWRTQRLEVLTLQAELNTARSDRIVSEQTQDLLAAKVGQQVGIIQELRNEVTRLQVARKAPAQPSIENSDSSVTLMPSA